VLENSLVDELIQPARFRVGFNLPVPGIVEIHLNQTLQKFTFRRFGEPLNGLYNFSKMLL